MLSMKRGPVKYGFEKDDVEQEEALGAILSERRKPGNKDAAKSRSKVRAARHRKREYEWNSLRVTIRESDKVVDEKVMFDKILLHEILDMLPYAMKEEILRDLSVADGRNYRRFASSILEVCPFLKKEDQ